MSGTTKVYFIQQSAGDRVRREDVVVTDLDDCIREVISGTTQGRVRLRRPKVGQSVQEVLEERRTAGINAFAMVRTNFGADHLYRLLIGATKANAHCILDLLRRVDGEQGYPWTRSKRASEVA